MKSGATKSQKMRECSGFFSGFQLALIPLLFELFEKFQKLGWLIWFGLFEFGIAQSPPSLPTSAIGSRSLLPIEKSHMNRVVKNVFSYHIS